MKIRKLDTERRRDVLQFIALPFELYRGCPQWVPPFRAEMVLALDRRRYPYHQHSPADFYVVESEGETLGRVAVAYNKNHNHHHGTRDAFFYYFDTVDDRQVSDALFQEAFGWARAQGADRMIGPKGLLQVDGLGLLVEGYEHRPAMGIPYNWPYYDALLREAGFEKETDYLSGYLRGDHQLDPRFDAVAAKVLDRRGLRIKSFTSEKELRRWIGPIGEVYNGSFTGNWEYCPVNADEMRIIGARLLAISNPRLIKLVMQGEAIIGFLFAFPDISAALQRTKGRLWPFGWLCLLREFKATRWVNFNGTGLLPEHRGVGANAILYTEMAKTVREFGLEHADVVQVEERNGKSLGDMTAIGVQWYKRHRVYRRMLG